VCTIAVGCQALEVSRAGFYAWRRRPESAHDRDDRRLTVLVRQSHERSRRTYGRPRVHAELAAQGERITRKRVIRLMQGTAAQGSRAAPGHKSHDDERPRPARGGQPAGPPLRR
jgi:hypothetical protein